MVISAVVRKSVSDLTRRRARAVFAVAALALAVASVGLFALPSLMSRAMDREIAANKLADVTITVKPLPLTLAQLQALGRVPNVVAFDPRATFSTRVYIGARRQQAFLISKTSFARQTVDVVTVTAGSAPGPGAVLSDAQNAAYGDNVGGTGGSVRLIAANGRVVSLPISGQARNLTGAQMVAQNGFVTLYSTAQTVAALSGTPGYTRLAFRLRDNSTTAARRTVTAVRQFLQTVPGFTGFSDLPEIRTPGDWPGKSRFSNLTSILYVVTLLALAGALVLLSSTMTTLIGEQTPEIATMKAIGAGRKQIRHRVPAHRRAARDIRRARRRGARGPALLGADVVLRLLAVRDQRPVERRSAGAGRQRGGRGDRAAAGCAARDPPRRTAAAGRDAAGDRWRDRPRGASGADAAPRALPAPHRADRSARRHPPAAAQHRDRAAGWARRRDAARVPLVGHQRRQHREPVLELLPLQHRRGIDAGPGAPAKRRRS